MNDPYESVSDQILKPNSKNSRTKATEIWIDFCDKKIPIRLNDIVQKLGIHARAETLTIDGITRTENGICCILYNKNIPLVRQRFTVAHEIGHIVLEHTSIFGDCNQYSKNSQESEANNFANELLVPSADLKQFVKQRSPTIQEIIDRYQVSREVVFIAIEKNRLLSKVRP